MLNAILIVLSAFIWVGMFAYFWRVELYQWYDNRLRPERSKVAQNRGAPPERE